MVQIFSDSLFKFSTQIANFTHLSPPDILFITVSTSKNGILDAISKQDFAQDDQSQSRKSIKLPFLYTLSLRSIFCYSTLFDIFRLKFHWFCFNIQSTTSIRSKTIIYSFCFNPNEIFYANFLELALISQRIVLEMPDWSQIKDICIFFYKQPI